MIRAEHAMAAVHEFQKQFLASKPRVPHIPAADESVASALW